MVKVAIVGAGFVGSTVAYALALRSVVEEIVLVDVKGGTAEGKALDIAQSVAVFGLPVRVHGGIDFSLMKGANIVIITAGVPRKPEQKREDNLAINASIMKDVIAHVLRDAPNALLVIVSNPLDIMTYLAAKESGFEKRRIIGMAGTLDTARYKAFIAERLSVNPAVIEAHVLGGHGDLMVPLSGHTKINGKPLADFLADEEIEAIERRTQVGGAEIVNLLGQSAYYAPGASTCEVIEAIVRGSKKPVPVSAWLDGQYGLDGLFLGVPCVLSMRGVEEIVELPLDEKEREALRASAEHVRSFVKELA